MESVIFQDANYRICRGMDPDDGPVLIKTGLTQELGERLRATLAGEKRILELLQDVPGCPRLLDDNHTPSELRMADTGGIPLSQSGLPGHLDLDRFLRIAVSLAGHLAAIHDRRVIHKSLRPESVLVRPDDLSLLIINFEEATGFAVEEPNFETPDYPVERLRYVSPEQMGRVCRTVDYRTDLYSLGATLYALATGCPPFADTDLLALMHALLAREPQPPQALAAWLPEPLAQIILTLIAKEPDDRYQSAAGLLRDLQALSRVLEEHRPLTSVRLRAGDLPLSPRKPSRLHGRDRELTVLQNAFAATQRGGVQGVFLAGYPGVGKTSLILELYRTLDLSEGWFVQGKFDQFQRNQPFQAPAQALAQLCQKLLKEPASSQETRRRRLLAELGPDLGAIFEVAPDLQALVGPQPAPPELDPVRAIVRLRGLLLALIRAVAKLDHPLIMFFDDLQWADQPSLDFIRDLLQENTLNGLLLVGAYRDNDIDSAHPLNRVLSLPLALRATSQELTLTNLDDEAIAALLGDMLQTPPADARDLANLLRPKTEGNPYYTIEMVQALYREELLRPDLERGTWQWDRAKVAAHSASDNVVEFLVRDLSGSPTLANDALVALACLGDACTLGRLALATGAPGSELIKSLTPAVERGILVTSNLLAFQQADTGALLRFCHDRMRQAVHQLRDEPWLLSTHLHIARRFSEVAPLQDYGLCAAEHYAYAVSLVLEPQERSRARELFMQSARRARLAGAFAIAERFVRLAIELLQPARTGEISPPDQISQPPDIMAGFNEYSELHLLFYSQSRHEEADDIYALLAANAVSSEQLVEPACIQIASLSNRTLYNDAIRLAAELLGALGLSVPLEDTLRVLEQDLGGLYRHAEATDGALLPCRPASANPRSCGIAKLMNRTIPAAFFSQPLTAFWLATRCTRFWLEEGYRDSYLYPAVCTLLTSIAMRGDFHTGFRIAQEALDIGARFEGGIETARAQHIFGLLGAHWFRPLQQDLEYAHHAFEGLMRGGELEFACFTHFTSLAALLDTGTHLSELESEVAVALGFAHKYGNLHAAQSFLVFRQLIRAFHGETAAAGDFNDAEFDESSHQATVQGNPMARAFFHTYRALSASIFVQDAGLSEHAEAAYELKSYITGFYPVALIHILHALGSIRQLGRLSGLERIRKLDQLNTDMEWLAARAADAPMNFGHLLDWLEAERHEALGETTAALQSFDRAMRGAQLQHRHWHHALITENAGNCHMRYGLEQTGRFLLGAARDVYREWGAQGKVESLHRQWPFLGLQLAGLKDHIFGDRGDYQALLRASQALASEHSLPRLLDRVIGLLAQMTGATDVRLTILDDAGRWFLEGGVRGAEKLDRMPLEEAEERGIISASGIKLALKTAQPVISEDAVMDSRFAGDPHFAGLSLCSLLGLPVFVQGRLTAFLVLENRLLRSAFTMEHVEILSLLCGQLATSIENIRVFQSLERKVAERTAQLQAATEAKSQFLASMSHEIRTPMNGVLGMAQLLAQEPMTADQNQMVQSILTAGRSLLNIINDILDLSKIEAGQLQLDPHPFDLSGTLTQLVSIGSVNARAKGIELRLEADPATAGFWLSDSLRLEQVLFNLMGNAIKFTERGEVIIRVTGMEPANQSVRLRFEVQDTGIGMSADAVDRLFTPFSQADKSITRRFGGTGLGLSISKRLVEMMGGEIGVRSDPGVGSVFWFDWPTERVETLHPAPKEEHTGKPEVGASLQGLRILIVEDNSVNRIVAQRALQRAGADSTLAHDGAEALTLLREHPRAWDVILMDIQMPVMDGLTATRAIRCELGLKDIPVIALTAGVMTEERREALDAGANDFLPKPMDLEQMVQIIRKYCPTPSRNEPH